jgi:hypothetical protein
MLSNQNMNLNLKKIFDKFINFINIFLLTLNSNEGLRVCFISIYVATILTTYEIFMFYVFVVPEIYKQINTGIFIISSELKNKNIKINIEESFIFYIFEIFNATNSQSINVVKSEKNYTIPNLLTIENNLNFINYLIQNENAKLFILSILKTLNEREKILVNKNNNYTIITCCLLISLLIFSLSFILLKLKNRNESIGIKVWISSWFTIIMILIFQYSFFIYANNYKYMGITDINELIYYILNYL